MCMYTHSHPNTIQLRVHDRTWYVPPVYDSFRPRGIHIEALKEEVLSAADWPVSDVEAVRGDPRRVSVPLGAQ